MAFIRKKNVNGIILRTGRELNRQKATIIGMGQINIFIGA